MNLKKRLKWIRVLAVLAILVSLYLTFQHFEKGDSNFCVFGASFNCNLVNKSPYATVDGILYFLTYDLELATPYVSIPIPNAIISVLVFTFVFLAAGSLSMGKSFLGMERNALITTLKLILYLSLAYAIYLAYIEAFILLNYCIFCIALDVLIIVILWLVIGLHKGSSSPLKKSTKNRVRSVTKKTIRKVSRKRKVNKKKKRKRR